jgi:hypothetical protein
MALKFLSKLNKGKKMQPNQFKKPPLGKSPAAILISGWKTPKLKVIFSNIVKPFYYPNSPQTPRHSVTVLVDPVLNKEFMDQIIKMEANEKCMSQFRDEIKKDENGNANKTGKSLLKFQLFEGVPVFKMINGQPTAHDLVKELPRDSEIEVTFDVSRYTSKQTSQNGLSFRASQILIHDMPTATYKTYDAPESESAPF